MATFGPVTSPFANVLYNPMAVDQAVQGRQRNQLMMDNARQDQQMQVEDRRAAVFARDQEHVARASASILALPADQRPGAYATTLRQLRAAGIAPHAPEQYPGDAQLQSLVQRSMPVGAQLTRQDQQAERGALAGMFGGAPAAPASAAGGNVVAPPELMPHFEEASRATGVPVALLVAQAKQESGFRPDAVGRSGEGGIMQIMPSTARDPGFGMQGVDPATLRDPRANIMFGAQYLAARNRGVDWNNPQQRDAGLARYNGGGDPNYAANVTRNLPGGQPAPAQPTGPAARTGGVDVAGPGVPTAGLALDPPGTPAWAVGTTTEDQAALRAMSQAPGVTREEIIREATRMRQANRALQEQQRRHPTPTGDAAPFGGTGIEAQAYNSLLRIGPKIEDGTATQAERQQYALAHGHMTRGTTQLVDDGRGGQVLARIPGIVPEGFPAPNFRPGAAAPADAPAPGAAVPVPGTARAAHPTADQSKVATFAERIAAVLPIIEQNSAAGAGMTDRAMSQVPVIGGYLTSEAFQKADQAQRDFINAVLRRESGAAISDGEFDNARRQYFPQPGESAAVLKQKQENRERILSGFRREAGPAYQAAPPAADPPPAPAPGTRPPLASFGR